MPPLVGREAVCCNADLRCHHGFEFVIGDFEEGKQFSDQDSHIALVDQSETEIERSPPDTDIRVSQAIQNGVPVSLDSIRLNCDHFDQGVEGNVSDVVVSV